MQLVRDKSIPSVIGHLLQESARLRVMNEHASRGVTLTNLGRDTFMASKKNQTVMEKTSTVKDFLFQSLEL
tara:strand:- start:170 stop:382 length:213 start_codon:yes stop_codon:yes gene_type:complete